MTEGKGKKLKALYLRRIIQLSVLTGIILIPLYSQNPMQWSPSRIVLGHLPPPRVSPVTGDTWAISFGNFNLIHPLAFIDYIISAKRIYIPLVVAVMLPLAITLLFGRVFCSWLCPMGLIFELNQKVNRLMEKIGLQVSFNMKDYRYIFFTILLIIAFFFAIPALSVFDPPHILGREFMFIFTHHQFSLTGAVFIFAFLFIEAFSIKRLWCSKLCPSGGGLSILSAKRMLNIRMDKTLCIRCSKCDDACPYDLKPMMLSEDRQIDWLKCDNCGLCRDVCPTSAISYHIGIKHPAAGRRGLNSKQ